MNPLKERIKNVIRERDIHFRKMRMLTHIKQIFDKKCIRVAAFDSKWWIKITSNYVCDGINDLDIINKAISKAHSGGKIQLLDGNFNLVRSKKEKIRKRGFRLFG